MVFSKGGPGRQEMLFAGTSQSVLRSHDIDSRLLERYKAFKLVAAKSVR